MIKLGLDSPLTPEPALHHAPGVSGPPTRALKSRGPRGHSRTVPGGSLGGQACNPTTWAMARFASMLGGAGGGGGKSGEEEEEREQEDLLPCLCLGPLGTTLPPH